jgi:hypothetical protein
MNNEINGAGAADRSIGRRRLMGAPPSIVTPPPIEGSAGFVSPGVKMDGGGWIVTASGRIVRVPPWDPPYVGAKWTERGRVAARTASLATGITALASWLGEDGRAIQKEAAKLLVESASELGPTTRAASTTDPIPRSPLSTLVSKVRRNVLGWGASTPDPIPGVVSDIYRAMERLTGDMFARQGDDSPPRSERALQELALCAAIRQLSTCMDDRGQAIERHAAKLTEQRSREIADAVG